MQWHSVTKVSLRRPGGYLFNSAPERPLEDFRNINIPVLKDTQDLFL